MGAFIALLIIGGILLLVAIGSWLVAFASDEGEKAAPAAVGAVAFVLAAVMGFIILGMAHQSIPARNVGVVTLNGKPTSVLNNGGHWTAPWAKVTVFPTTVQPLTVDQKVRLANNTEATVDVSALWQIDANNQFLDLYNSYQTFDAVRDNVVKRQLAVALNNQFADWDPLAVIDSKTGTSSVSVTDFAVPVEQAVNAKMPAGAKLLSVAVVKITYSNGVQANLDAITKAAAQTRVAQQQEQTNAAQAAANAKLGNGVQAYQQNCINATLQAMADNYQLPASWNCNGTSTSPLISVPAK